MNNKKIKDVFGISGWFYTGKKPKFVINYYEENIIRPKNVPEWTHITVEIIEDIIIDPKNGKVLHIKNGN